MLHMIVKLKKNSKELFGKPRTFQKGLTYDMCENVCVSNKTCNFFTHTPKGFESKLRLNGMDAPVFCFQLKMGKQTDCDVDSNKRIVHANI